jgi:hypothetical protein
MEKLLETTRKSLNSKPKAQIARELKKLLKSRVLTDYDIYFGIIGKIWSRGRGSTHFIEVVPDSKLFVVNTLFLRGPMAIRIESIAKEHYPSWKVVYTERNPNDSKSLRTIYLESQRNNGTV